ncbi:MAG: selenocysteine synthase [Cyclobacteriaceae bacterium]|nr:selenocysteine synthase [Cyclobacteriaceae bacterium]
MNRREILRQLSVIPLVGTTMTPDLFASRVHPLFPSAEENIYRSIGVEPIINCRGTFTILGGSVERPEVIEAMKAASGYFAQYDELAYGIGQRLGELTQTEWGVVTAGCAAAMKHFTAACVTGGNPEKLIRIPDLTGLKKTEVIIPRYSRNVYDHAVRNVGVKVITVDTPEEMKKAINERTAMIYVLACSHSQPGQPFSLEVIAGMAGPLDIPVLLDAAAEDLTIPPVHLAQGATVAAYSGGKAICGPQCAGLLLGKKDILISAWQASSPHHGPGRDNKVGKEEMMGMLAAVEAWIARDHEAEWERWMSWLDLISGKMLSIKGIKTRITQPEGLSNHAPVLHIEWDPDELHITGEEVAEEVARNKTRIAIGSRTSDELTSINITPNQMQPGNAEVVAERLHGILKQKRKPRTDQLTPAAADLNGHWEIDVSFPSSNSRHILFIEQDGNWIQGMHQTDFELLPLVGIVEGKEIKLRSDYRIPGNSLIYLFSAKIENEKLTGSIYLGEYLNATFSGNRILYNNKRRRITIPGGPPLAT